MIFFNCPLHETIECHSLNKFVSCVIFIYCSVSNVVHHLFNDWVWDLQWLQEVNVTYKKKKQILCVNLHLQRKGLPLVLHWVPLTTSNYIQRTQLVVNGTYYNRTSLTLVSVTEISALEKNLLVVTGCS